MQTPIKKYDPSVNLRPFPKGISPNPGGVPKCKRVATWLAEFGEMDPSEWPDPLKSKTLPANARIALARLKQATKSDGVRDAEYVEPRKGFDMMDAAGQPALIQGIALAIMAMKAAGVLGPPGHSEPAQHIEAETIKDDAF